MLEIGEKIISIITPILGIIVAVVVIAVVVYFLVIKKKKSIPKEPESPQQPSEQPSTLPG